MRLLRRKKMFLTRVSKLKGILEILFSSDLYLNIRNSITHTDSDVFNLQNQMFF